MFKNILLTGAVISGLAMVPAAQAVIVTNGGSTIFNSGGFENDTVGSNPSANSAGDGWYFANSGAGTTLVSNTSPFAATGQNFMSGDTATTRAMADFGAQNAGNIHAEFKYLVGDDVGAISPNVIQFSQKDASAEGDPFSYAFGDRITFFSLGATVAGQPGLAGGKNYSGAYADITSGGNVMTWNRNEWLDVEIDWTIGQSTFLLTVDGVQSDPLAIQAGYESRTPNGLLFMSNNSNPNVYFAVDGIPEPASLALLGLGGLLVLRRRKH